MACFSVAASPHAPLDGLQRSDSLLGSISIEFNRADGMREMNKVATVATVTAGS